MTDLEQAIAERTRLLALLSTLPAAGSVSEGGRSVSVNRRDVLAQIKDLTELIALLGGPYAITSTADTGY